MATASKKSARKQPATTRTPAKETAPAKAAAASKAAAPKAKAGSAKKDATSDKLAGAGKAARPAKTKLVRDSFNIPKAELAVLEELKARAARLGQPAKKSEVLRAGIKALGALGDAAFLATVTAIGPAKAARNAPKA
jgi:hypothetical protein